MNDELQQYPTIDIMNHLGEIGGNRASAGEGSESPAIYKEFEIMMQTTFKRLARAQPPGGGRGESGSDAGGGNKKRGGLLGGHSSPEECVEDMDRLGYKHIVVSATKMWSYYYHHKLIIDTPIEPIGEAIKSTGGRIIGGGGYSAFDIGGSIAELERGVREMGFKYIWFHPLSFGLPPNDRRFYPLYQKCMELDIAVGMQVGHSAEVLPSDVGRPMLCDDVAIDFPHLRINLSHTGWPWVDEWCSMLWRHPNVYGDISAYFPKSLDERQIRFMDSGRGRDKVLFGTNGLGLERCKKEFLELDIKEETKRAVLYDNAVQFLKLEDSQEG
ncbi:MAG TPA: amidohydrolase family protein [Dehalococcoidia bacterium]|nr:amidohydrolase family protein [Dehalococcoidia bacterium]